MFIAERKYCSGSFKISTEFLPKRFISPNYRRAVSDGLSGCCSDGCTRAEHKNCEARGVCLSIDSLVEGKP